MALEFFDKLKFLLSFLLYFFDEFWVRGRITFDDGFDLWSFRFGDKRFFCHNLGDEFVDVGLLGKVEQVDTFGFNFTITADILESDAWRVVPDQYFL